MRGVGGGTAGGKEVCMVPKDPVILFGFVNLKLRDFYSSLEDLCEDLDLVQEELEEKLAAAGYHYDPGKNQFV